MEKITYTKNCLEFLHYKCVTPDDKDFRIYEGIIFNLPNTIDANFNDGFLNNWNWIMEVVTKIQLLDIVHDNTRSYDSVFKEYQCTFSPQYKTHDFGYIVGKSKTSEKEAVVDAINQFLIWYNKNSK